jgi:hypothetical protein
MSEVHRRDAEAQRRIFFGKRAVLCVFAPQRWKKFRD